MAVTTKIYGYLYNAQGVKITTGKLIISLNHDFVSIDGSKVAPFLTQVSMTATGLLEFGLCPTYNTVSGSGYGQAYPYGTVYTFEFDPAPQDYSLPLINKNGYWRRLYAIPHVSDTTANNEIALSALVPAVTTQAQYNPSFVPLSDNRLLTAEQKAILTGGPSSNADSLHTHDIAEDFITLEDTEEPVVSDDCASIYLTSTGTSPAKQIIVWGKLEDNVPFVIASAIV